MLVTTALTACGASGEQRSHASTLIVLDRSIGGVALGERRAQAENRLGKGLVVRVEDQKPPEPTLHIEDVLYAEAGLEVIYISRDDTQKSRAHGRVVMLLTNSPHFQTAGGVHVGSTASELRSIHGVRCAEMPNLDCQHGGHVHNQPGTMFQLTAPEAVVTRIAIARAD